jgi:hypothetical protein
MCMDIVYCQCFEFRVVELVYHVFCKKISNSKLIYDGWELDRRILTYVIYDDPTP